MLSSSFVRNQVTSDVVQPKDLLVFMKFFNKISKEKKYECLQNELKIPYTKVNTIGLKGIRERSEQYANIDSLLTDINQLARSYMIHFQSKCPTTYAKAMKFKEECQEEAATINKCADCYESWMNDKTRKQTAYFKLVCPKPHLLVFMKVEGFPIWPAKLFYVKNGMANVECFGDYLEDDIPIRDCFLYSKEIQREYSNDEKKQRELDLAYKEVNEHIKLIEEKFGAGSFISAPSKKSVTADLKKHLKEMFPGAYPQSSVTINAMQAISSPPPRFKLALFEGQSTSNCSTSYTQDNINTNEDNALEDSEYSDFNGFPNNNSEDLNGHDHLDDASRSMKSEHPFDIEDVIENYSSHDGAQDIDSHIDNNDDGDSTLNESQARFKAKPENTTENGQNHGMQKRPHTGTKGRTNSVSSRKSGVSQADNSTRADELEIIGVDEDDSDETNATTEKKRKVLKEYNEVNKQIYILETQLDELKKRSDKLGSVLIQW